MVDFTASQNVDQYIANSEEVQRRILKFYRKDAVVIYPPVNNVASSMNYVVSKKNDTKYKLHTTDYFLAGGRLARPKHIDLIIKTANEMGIPLKVFGKAFAGYEEELRSLARGTIEFVGEVSDEEKIELMTNAKAYIMAAEDEDFGILPVEAMAAGCPVIAYKSGGVRETVIDGKTGIFFDELTVESLREVLKQFEKTKISSDACRKRAEEFSKERFMQNIKKILQ
ncbi:MAG: glycosyltransferase, partial [Candidatus Levybacteria bacterium]|nr:glycosyltransferase [Candidatus Levybacteria bacterium]